MTDKIKKKYLWNIKSIMKSIFNVADLLNQTNLILRILTIKCYFN